MEEMAAAVNRFEFQRYQVRMPLSLFFFLPSPCLPYCLSLPVSQSSDEIKHEKKKRRDKNGQYHPPSLDN